MNKISKIVTWVTIIFVTITKSESTTAPFQCLGSYQLCDTGDCVLVDEYCGRCASKQYLCPDMNSCLDDVHDYEKCPNIKETHFDWTMDIEKRLDYLVKVATLDEKYRQLTHDAPGIPRYGIPAYNWLNDNQHGVRNPHATAFPNGCAMGASWSKFATRSIAAKIAYESRSVFNDLTNVGIRGTGISWGGGGSTITIYAPNLNLVRDPRWGRAQEVFTEDPLLSAQLTVSFVKGLQEGDKKISSRLNEIFNNISSNSINNNNNNEEKYLLTAACCKHFSAYNLESRPMERYYFNAIYDGRNWAETYSPQFYSCIVEAKGAHVMCAYNKVNDIPACANKELLTEVLRKQWNFNGFVVSDYDAMAQIYETHKYARNYEQAVSYALKAGCDQEGGGTVAINQIPEAIKHGLLTIDDINLSFRRLFRIRIKLGLFDPPHRVPYNYLNHSSYYNEESSLQIARKVAQRSICLYKNINNILPLNKNNIKKLAIIGPQAIDTNLLLGNYATYPDEGVVNIIRALREAIGENQKSICTQRKDIDYIQPGQEGIYAYNVDECCKLCMEDDNCYYYSWANNHCYLKETSAGRTWIGNRISGTVLNKIDGYPSKIIYRRGCSNSRCNDRKGFSAVNTLLQEHGEDLDAVIVTLGLDQSLENEGNDRADIELPGLQNNLVSLISKHVSDINKHNNNNKYIPIICILIHGGAIALGRAADECDCIIDAWYPGSQGGHAIADVIFGDYNPAGRTPVTFYKSTQDLPNEGELNWYAGKGISYRYFKGEPLYPFGFGLSYTNFTYSNLKINLTKISNVNIDIQSNVNNYYHNYHNYHNNHDNNNNNNNNNNNSSENQDSSLPYYHINKNVNVEYIIEKDNLCDYIAVTVTVTNIGDRDGDEIIQLYANHPDATVPVPLIRLVDFERVFIKAGESKNVNLLITPRYRTVVYDSKLWYEPNIMIEKGQLNIFVGGGQPKYYPNHLSTAIYVTDSIPFSECPYQN